MAITRIKNNQITDSSAGNAFLGINAAVKVQDYSITSGKISNNLTYNSNLTITGNLTVQGNVTTIDTIDLVVEDPLILLASNQTGTPDLDIGFIGKRGTSDNIAWVWDESADEFAAAFTSSEVTNTTVTISSYASVHMLDLTANAATFTGDVAFGNITIGNIVGDATVTGNVDANNVNATNAITAGTTITATGNITGGNLTTAGITSTGSLTASTTIDATGNITGGNLTTAGVTDTGSLTASTTIDATGNITGGNLITAGLVSAGTTITATGNITGGNVGTAGQVTATGNVTGGNLVTAGSVSAGTTIDATGNITGGNLITAGTVDAGSITSSTTIDATGNISGGNITTIGSLSGDTLETLGNALIGGNLIVQGNITYINIDDLRVEDPIIVLGTGPNGAPLSADDGKDRGVFMEYYTSARGNAYMGWDNSSGNMVIANDVEFSGNDVVQINAYGTLEVGNIYAQSATVTGSFSVTGNIDGGNLNTAGQVVATGNVTGGNVNTAGQVVATGNVTGGNIITAGTVDAGSVTSSTTITATGNITGGNLTTAGITSTGSLTASTTIDATGNITGGNLTTAGVTDTGSLTASTTIDATGNITGGNIVTGGQVTATGNITGGNVIGTTSGKFGNIVISGDDITDVGGGIVNINSGLADVDFAVNGDTNANIFYVDAGTETASFGSATQTTDAIVAFNATNSILLPVGNTATRPATGVTGMIRFNTTNNQLEYYDVDSWTTAGTQFTVITADEFNGDGSTVAFTLGSNSTTAATIVSINGIVQIPTVAYSVSGNVLTFTEAPVSQDVIDARVLTTTQTIIGLQNASGNAVFEGSATESAFTLQGNLLPTANVTYDLGSPTLRWRDGYFSGATLTLGNIVMKNTGGNSIGFFGPDGTTPATLDANVQVVGDAIASGTSNVSFAAGDGNVLLVSGGTTTGVITSTGANVTGYITATGNITGGNLSGTSIVGTLTTAAQTNITSVGTLGSLNVTGNISGGNLSGTSIVGTLTTAAQTNITSVGTLTSLNVTGNISGGNLSGTSIVGTLTTAAQTNITSVGTLGSLTVTGNVTGGNLITAGLVSLSSITKTGSNGVGNIGSVSNYFNTVFAKATSAQYADLAEMYEADADIAPGTVVAFGGDKEVTTSSMPDDKRVAGVVSTNPSYLMNSAQEGEYVVAVAMTGRVPCRVTGAVRKGDLMVSAGDGSARANNDAGVGTVIGKALENFDGVDGVIEVVVGRF